MENENKVLGMGNTTQFDEPQEMAETLQQNGDDPIVQVEAIHNHHPDEMDLMDLFEKAMVNEAPRPYPGLQFCHRCKVKNGRRGWSTIKKSKPGSGKTGYSKA